MAQLFRYVALGDSTAIGTGAGTDGGYPERLFRRLKASGINAGILNLGRSGVVPNMVDLSAAPIAGLIDALLHIPRQQFSRRLEEMNAIIGALRRRAKFEVVDLFGETRSELANHPEYFSADGFHPSAAGYDRWAQLLWPAVAKIAKSDDPGSPSSSDH